MSKVATTGEPVYMQIALEIREDIFEGNLKPGDMLESESQLQNRYSASKVTVRKSLSELAQEGLVYSRPGKGYFVSEPTHGLFELDFSHEDEGLESVYSDVNIIKPDIEIAEALAISSQWPVIKISKTLMLHNQPVAFDLKYLPYDKGTPIVEAEMHYAVFPEIAAEKTAPFAFYTKMRIGAEQGTDEICQALRCKKEEPLLVIHRYLIDKDERRIGFGKKYLLKGYGFLEAVSGYRAES